MKGNLVEVMDHAMGLSQEDRAILVSQLWGSLDHALRLPPDEMETVLTAYRRDREMETGAVKTYTFDEVLAEMDNVLHENNLS